MHRCGSYNARLDTVLVFPRAAALLLALVALPVLAAKDPQVIRQHLQEHPDKSISSVKSVEPHLGDALDDLITTRMWEVAYETERGMGESLIFMAVQNGEALRIHDFDQPGSRENFVKLLPEDFRVDSQADAARIVAATLDLYFGFPFSEPEKSVDEMGFERRGKNYYFIDGERFGDATGYQVTTDDEGRVIAYEYSWRLPVDPPQED